MNCEFAEKVSMLVDGELPAAEIEAVRAHIDHCRECGNLEKDFLFFRRQLKESMTETREIERISALPERSPKRLWNRWVALPAPVLVVVSLVLIGLSAWLAVSRLRRVSNESVMPDPAKNAPFAKPDNPPNQASLARYDGGGRTEIYVVSRGQD